MKRRAVYIDKIRIDRARGIRPETGFELTELSPGVNLIYGPNGSGKSTTCAATQELLWPGTLERPTVSGTIIDEDDVVQVDIDAGHAAVYRNEHSAGASDFGSSERRKRYHLSLRDLILDRDEDFAQKVADAGRGGYDLDAAAMAIGARTNPKSAAKLSRQVSEAQNKVSEARRAQQKVLEEVNRLDQLEADYNRAEAAARELLLLEKLKEYRTLINERDELQHRLDSFPPSTGMLQGDEQEKLDGWATRREELIKRRRDAEQRIELAERELEDAGLLDEIPHEVIAQLKSRCKDMEVLEAEIRDQQRIYSESGARADKALKAISEALTVEQLEMLEKVEQPDLSEFARRVHQTRARREVLDERERWLFGALPDELRNVSREDFTRGIDALTEWLAVDDGERETPLPDRLLLISALVAAAIGIGTLVLASEWIAALFVLVAAIFVGLFLWKMPRHDARENPKKSHEARYRRLPLPPPSDWSSDEVRSTLSQIIKMSGQLAVEEERLSHRPGFEVDQKRLSQQEEELEAELEKISQRFGFMPDLDPDWLPVLTGRIRSWQEASASALGAESALREAGRRASTLRDEIGTALAQYGYPAVASSSEASQHVRHLEGRNQRLVDAKRVIADASREIDSSITPDVKSLDEQRDALYDRVGITAEDTYLLKQWLDALPDYTKCVDEINLKVTLLERDRLKLEEDARSMQQDVEELFALGPSDLEQRIKTCETKRDGKDELRDVITRTRERTESAKAGRVLADALEEYDSALGHLEKAREENSTALTAGELTDWIRRESIDRSRPAVFERANRLFTSFTGGTLHLSLDDHSSPPAFVARRGTGPVQSLDELSDGERIQLLVAVRLAFLEHDEAKRLPLIVDEVLGTSDDGRSGVIIDTLIKIAEVGRQVIYCTAQRDEIGKWIAHLNESNVPYQRFDLAEIRGLTASDSSPLEIPHIEFPNPPAPDGLGYDAYASSLNVPGIDPAHDSIDELHVWHVLDDVDELYGLLMNRITTWNQLRTLMDHGAPQLLDSIDETRARARAKAIERASECWRIGRPRSVDRRVLEDSDAVSPKFFDSVASLCAQLEGDAAALLEALDRGEVPFFRNDSILKLRDYLEEHRYLPTVPILSAEEIRLDLLSHLDAELGDGSISSEDIERTLAALRLDDVTAQGPHEQMENSDGAVPLP